MANATFSFGLSDEQDAILREILELQRRERRVDRAILTELQAIADALKDPSAAEQATRLRALATRLGAIAQT